MGLSSFPGPGEGVLPLIVMNTVMSVALVKNKLRSVLQVVGAASDQGSEEDECCGSSRERRVSITRYGSLCRQDSRGRGDCSGGECLATAAAAECCVCLCRFEAEEEVSELSCKHFFHKGCLDKWFDNQHITCPLCRSII